MKQQMKHHHQSNQANHVLRNSLLAILSAIMIATICYNWLDLLIANYFYFHPHPLLTEISCVYFKTMFSGTVWLPIGLLSLLFAGIMYVVRKPSWAYALFFFAVVSLSNDLITGILKVVLARSRPEAFFEMNDYGFHFFSTKWLYNSMPSGRTSIAFANLMALAVLIKKSWVTVVFVLVAIMVAISRLICGEHYLGDVITGAYVGLLTVYWVQAFFARFVHAKS
jgi:membrane-associated phospholipid phosphatase